MGRTRDEYNEYMREYMLARYNRRLAAAIEQLGGECVRCGTTEDLQFDHIDPATKLFTICGVLNGVAEAKLQAELAKCQLLCEPHHIEKTRDNGENRPGRNRVADPEHGTQVMYHRERCRCKLCRRWRKLYRMKLVDARGFPCEGVTTSEIEAA